MIDKATVHLAFNCSSGLNIVLPTEDEAQDVINLFSSFIQNGSLVCVRPRYQSLILGFLQSHHLLTYHVAWRHDYLSFIDDKYIDLL